MPWGMFFTIVAQAVIGTFIALVVALVVLILVATASKDYQEYVAWKMRRKSER